MVVGFVCQYQRSKELAPDEIGEVPLHSQQVGVWFTAGLLGGGMSWPFVRVTAYDGFFVVSVTGERYVFDGTNVTGIECDSGCLWSGVEIAHSNKYAPRTVILRSRSPERLAGKLRAALDSHRRPVS